LDSGINRMSDTVLLTIDHIVKTPGTLGGRPCIRGHRIAVDHVVSACVYGGIDVSEFCENYDLTPAQVYAALSYYYDNTEEIDGIIRDTEEFLGQMKPEMERSNQEMLARFGDRFDDFNRMMTVTEISEEFGITPAGVREACRKGWIQAEKSGSTWLIRRLHAKERWGK
jgi:uncharacterized protein (DUF433 family)